MKINNFLMDGNEIIVIDNFLDEKNIKRIQNEILDPYFSWYYQDITMPFQNDYVKLNDKHSYEAPFFAHGLLHDNGNKSPWYEICRFIVNATLYKLRTDYGFGGDVDILRGKINLYPTIKESEKKLYHTPHIDNTKKSHSVFLYFANDSDGNTIIFNEKNFPFTVKKIIEPKAGRLAIFNGDLYHASNSPVNHANRITININVN